MCGQCGRAPADFHVQVGLWTTQRPFVSKSQHFLFQESGCEVNIKNYWQNFQKGNKTAPRATHDPATELLPTHVGLRDRTQVDNVTSQ